MDGSTWADFCDSLKEAGQLLDRELAPQNPFDRAQGYRYLARMLRAGLESFLEYGDPAFPVLRCPVHENIKMGADNPDNYYQNAPVDAQYDYRIRFCGSSKIHSGTKQCLCGRTCKKNKNNQRRPV